MSAPPEPALGQLGRGRTGSVTGGPWQLVEVNNNAQPAKVRSQPPSPQIPLLRTPPSQPAADPVIDEDPPWVAELVGPDPQVDMSQPSTKERWEWEPDGGDWAEWQFGGQPQQWHQGGQGDWQNGGQAVSESKFDPQLLVGAWCDNLGHRIVVKPADQNRGGNRRRRGGGGRLTFLATFSRAGGSDKRFNISRDRGEWRCGNGRLDPDKSDAEGLVWQTQDDRISTWTPAPPAQEGEEAARVEPVVPSPPVYKAPRASKEAVSEEAGHGASDDDRAADDHQFSPQYFVGDWNDNLGHRILVMPTEQPRGGNNRGRKGDRARERLTFLAVFQKLDEADKRFNITLDKDTKQWKCGNGKLEFGQSDAGSLVWRAQDAKLSTWKRAPPEGAVYFDAPPAYEQGEQNVESQWIDGAIYYANTSQGTEWHEFNFPADGEEDMMQHQQQNFNGQGGGMAVEMVMVEMPMDSIVNADYASAPSAATGSCFNAAAPEFVMPSAPVAIDTPAAGSSLPSSPWTGTIQTPTPSPGLGPVSSTWVKPAAETTARRPRWASMSDNPGGTPISSPLVGPARAPHLVAPSPNQGPARAPRAQPSPQLGPAAAPTAGPTVKLSEESPDVQVVGNNLEWTLPDSWGKLSKFPKDFCITSPMFGVERAANMQLAFYPSGSRTAEAGHCTVALTRGPDSAGIKFEILVNSRGIGPKVCLGRRYLGDYARPFDDSEENKTQKVVVSMQVHNILS